MKRGIIALILIVLMSSLISADIIFTQQVKSVYNLGDIIEIPVTVKTLSSVTGSFTMDLICNGTAVNFYKYSGIKLSAGEEKNLDASLILIKGTIGDKTGTCRIKAMLNGDYKLSNEFKISNSLNIEGNLNKVTFDSGEFVYITGKIIRENGDNSDGFIDASISTKETNQNITQSGIVTDGDFSMNISLPNSLRAGNYLIKLKAFERSEDGVITNTGNSVYDISVNQVPTNLELIIDSKIISPKQNLIVKAILHDQTGEPIDSAVFITIKNSNGKIIEQKEMKTGEVLEYDLKDSEPPATWNVYAVSNKLTAEDEFRISENEDINIEITNKTIVITNTGNVQYNQTILIKIGDNPVNVDVFLKVGQSKKYGISHPDEGEVQVEVIGGEGKTAAGTMSPITGGAIDIRELSSGSYSILAWILLILILGIIVFLLIRKIYKKPFVGHTTNKKKEDKKMIPILGNDSVLKNTNRAELSLSIKGEKQDASVICLKVKNLRELKSRRGSPSESISKIIDMAGDNKAVTYENQDYLFFILAPAKTRTFKNEKTALGIAENVQNILIEHNRMFKEKIEFGISVNYGTIVAKIESGVFKFMSMGTMITAAKKIASLSKEEILLSEKMNDLLRISTRTEKQVREGVPVFSIKEIKRENEEARKFIDRFVNRQQWK